MRDDGTWITQIAANIHLWCKRLQDRMLVCPGCPWSSSLPSFSIGLLPEESVSVHPSVEKKYSGLGLRWVGADAGNETRISRLDLCSLVGLESLVC
jgi:hypothetical protein